MYGSVRPRGVVNDRAKKHLFAAKLLEGLDCGGVARAQGGPYSVVYWI